MRWPGYQHVFFDCDSTLTRVEGIDVLADSDEKRARVAALTDEAMNGTLDLEEVYGQRLNAIQPTRADVQDIRRVYKKTVVEDAQLVIATLQALGHDVYIISGGLFQAVVDFGRHLGVARDHIRAVDLAYNQLGSDWWKPKEYAWDEPYMTFARGSLTVSDGKSEIVAELLQGKTGRSLLVGDGTSDLLAGRAVDLFVGFGGVVTRPRVAAEAPAFLSTASLAPILALAAGPAAIRRLQNAQQRAVFRKGLQLIAGDGNLEFKDERLNAKFFAAYQTVHSGTD